VPEPREIALEALEIMRAELGDDALFPSDKIWNYAADAVPSGRRPGAIGWLHRNGFIERTGNMVHAATPARAGSMTPEYRFIRPGAAAVAAIDSIEALCVAFEDDCADILKVSPNGVLRLTSALLSKRFLILTGLAGSGKTKLAQAFARWITPCESYSDPFHAGAKLEGARKEYLISNSDRLGVEVLSDEGTKVLLPRAIIEQWASYIERNNVPETIGAQELRDKVKAEGGDYSAAVQNFETHYKPAAFALM